MNSFDTNIIYIALNNSNQYNKSGGYGLGLMFTTDGGNHWYADTAFTALVNDEDYTIGNNVQVTKIGYAILRS